VKGVPDWFVRIHSATNEQTSVTKVKVNATGRIRRVKNIETS